MGYRPFDEECPLEDHIQATSLGMIPVQFRR